MNAAIIKKLIGKRVKSLRREKLLTQEGLAEKADLNPKYLSSLELGKENPTLDTLLKLSKALKVELSDIFILEHEQENIRQLKKSISTLIKEANPEKLKITAKLVRAILR